MKKAKKILAILLVMVITCSFASVVGFAATKPTVRYSVLVLDCSGSMSGSPIEELKKGATAFCNQVLKSKDDNKIAIVAFASYANVVCDFTNDINSLTSAINNLYANGGTGLAEGISEGMSLLENVQNAYRKNIVVMCDGYPNNERAAYDVVDNIPLDWNIYGLYYCQDGFNQSAENVMKTIGRNGYAKVESGDALTIGFIESGTTITENDANKAVLIIACPVDVEVTLYGKTLSKENPVTLFGNLSIVNDNGEEIKIVELAYNKNYDIKIKGYDKGSMDCTITYYSNNEAVHTVVYPSIPITNTTVITASIDNENTQLPLNVDNNGDGKIDNKINPGSETLKPVTDTDDNENNDNKDDNQNESFLSKIKSFFVGIFVKIKTFFSNLSSRK